MKPRDRRKGNIKQAPARKREDKFIRTREDWCPSIKSGGNFPNDAYNHNLGCDGLRVSLIELRGEPKEWRVCVWGGDDFGLDFDQPDETVAREMYAMIDDFTTKKEMLDLGFIYA